MAVTFAVASCQYPPGFLDRPVAEASYRALLRRLEDGTPPLPEALLLLGDQVYIDATAGFFDPTTHHDRFVRPYLRLLQMEPLQEIMPRLQVRMMLDDHEIEDNWEPIHGDREVSAALEKGRRAYLQYCSYPGEDLADPQDDAPVPLWTDFRIDGVPFFMADTRTERTARTARTVHSARIMSFAQARRLREWLLARAEEAAEVPKLIASPSILLPRKLRATHRNHVASALRSDAWDGYPRSLHRLLAFIADHQLRNVVFLSGDEHVSCDARARITGPKGSAEIRSIHSSPLYGPFPFANSQPADLAGDETFSFTVDDARYKCEVATQFTPGDGYALVTARQDHGRWGVDCLFAR